MRKCNLQKGLLCVLGWALADAVALAQNPPFGGTVYIDPDIIRSSGWSAFESLSYAGIGQRFVFDRRDDDFSTKSMHLFDATYTDGLTIELQVNSNDFASSPAEDYATHYAAQVGRLPTSLRADVATLWIHAGGGSLPWGGGNDTILIHVDIDAEIMGFEEEILFHEAAHTSYSFAHDTAPTWQAAQAADPTFISDYARDHATTEDVAESLFMWYALRYKSDRLEQATILATEATIPNRLAYFDALPFEISKARGDFNSDGAVNEVDLMAWETSFGAIGNAIHAQGDADGDADVDGSDFLRWQRQVGADLTPDALTAATIPEPTTLVLASLLFVSQSAFRRRLAK